MLQFWRLSRLATLCIVFWLSTKALTVHVEPSTRLHPFRFLNTHRHREKTFQLLATRDPVQQQLDCNKNPAIEENWYTQKLDHFNETDARTFGQRYFVNWQHFNASRSNNQPVVFLMIGGEGEMSKRWVCWGNFTYMQLAREHGAVVVQLEHRFFGKNKNMGDLSVPNLLYLTSEQALADANEFIQGWSAAEKERLGERPRWVAFGGSYPGSLAAWLRQKYPDATVGNVASSAPLWPKVNFWEYSVVMEQTIGSTSPECYNNVGTAFVELKTATLSDAGRAKLTRLFRIDPPLEPRPDDITVLLGNVFAAFQGIIQYTYDGRRQANFEGLDIANACAMMNNASVPLLERLSRVFFLDAKYDMGINETDIFDVRYDVGLKPFQNFSIDSDGASMRGWMWLSCTEFGWLQTTDKGNSLFGDILSLGSFYKLCMDLFDPSIDSGYTEARVRRAISTFGTADTYNASNVILPNGAFDPWSALGTNVSVGERHQISLLTDGAAHCSDMYPAYKGEPVALAATRQRVSDEVRYYLQSSEAGAGNAAAAVTTAVTVGLAAAMLMGLLMLPWTFIAVA